jgi:hypothetical protein
MAKVKMTSPSEINRLRERYEEILNYGILDFGAEGEDKWREKPLNLFLFFILRLKKGC